MKTQHKHLLQRTYLVLVFGFMYLPIAVLIAFIVGHKVFKINWIILSGAIAGGCTSAPGLGAAISATGSEEPTAGYGAAQPFAILANVLLATLFFNIV